MARGQPLHISISAREVVAFREPFKRWGRSFSDAGVALDEISDLRAAQEPLVLRVAAAGGSEAERELVAGDWLCDSGGAEPVRLPKPKWVYDRASREWSDRPWLDAWERCEDARWMLSAACRCGVDRRLVVLAACACVRPALASVPAGEDRPLRAVEAAEAWAHGRLGEGPVRAAAEACYEAAGAAGNAAIGAASAANAAYSVTDANASYAAANAASYAAYASSDDDWAPALLRMSDAVRGVIPTDVVLRAASK